MYLHNVYDGCNVGILYTKDKQQLRGKRGYVIGILASQIGEVMLKGINIAKIETFKIVTMGMVHVPEGRRTSTRRTLQENLEMVFTIFPRLEERKKQEAGTLSGGEQ